MADLDAATRALRDRIADAIPAELTATPHVGVGGARRLKIADAVLPVVLAAIATAGLDRERGGVPTPKPPADTSWIQIQREAPTWPRYVWPAACLSLAVLPIVLTIIFLAAR